MSTTSSTPSVPPAPKKGKFNKASSLVSSDEGSESEARLFFMEFPGDANTDEKNNLAKVFKFAKDHEVEPEYLDPVALFTTKFKENDFVVVPCFRGGLFNEVKKTTLKICGPPIIRECLEEEKQIPYDGHPVFSSVFEGANVSFTNIPPDEKERYGQMVLWMGGTISEGLTGKSTHLVTPVAMRNQKYEMAKSAGLPVMKPVWITSLWDSSKVRLGKFSAVSKSAVEAHKLQLFEGLEIAVSSIDHRSTIIGLIEQNGGKVPGNLSKSKTSHLVTDLLSGEKYDAALRWKTIKIVRRKWIEKCVEHNYLVDERSYHPDKLIKVDSQESSTSFSRVSSKRNSIDLGAVPQAGSSMLNSGGSVDSLESGTPVFTDRESSGGTRLSTGSGVTDFSSSSGKPPRPPPTHHTATQNVATGHHVVAQNGAPGIYAVPRHRATGFHTVTRNVAPALPDSIEALRRKVDGSHRYLFGNNRLYVAGVTDKDQEQWRRFLNETGATRAPNMTSATHIIVISPSPQEKMAIRKLADEGKLVVTVQWLFECVKKNEVELEDAFEWMEMENTTTEE